jgi:hypothetical protein
VGSDGGGEDHRSLIHTMIAIAGSIERRYRSAIQMQQGSYTKGQDARRSANRFY